MTLLSKQNLMKVFKYIDTEALNVLTEPALKQFFLRRGEVKTEEEFTQML